MIGGTMIGTAAGGPEETRVVSSGPPVSPPDPWAAVLPGRVPQSVPASLPARTATPAQRRAPEAQGRPPRAATSRPRRGPAAGRDRTVRVRTPLATATYGLVLLVAAAFWYFVVATLFVSRLAPLIAGWEVTAVASGSMEPAIGTGDIVAYQAVDVSNLAPGRIIVFEDPTSPGSTLVHRFVGFHDDGRLTTKGDANGGADSTPVPADSVLGAVKMVSPFGGYATMLRFTEQHGKLAALIVATALSAIVTHAPAPRVVGSRRRWELLSR